MDPDGLSDEALERIPTEAFLTLLALRRRRHAREMKTGPESSATSEPVPSLDHTSEETTYANEPEFDPYETSPHFDHSLQSPETILSGSTEGTRSTIPETEGKPLESNVFRRYGGHDLVSFLSQSTML